MASKSQNRYIVYELVDNCGIPYYVGYTNNLERRRQEHISRIKGRFDYNNPYLCRKIKKLEGAGYLLQMDVLDYTNSMEEAQEKEVRYIAYYRKCGINLCNLTDGGEGRKGFVTPQYVKDKISKSKKGTHWGKHSAETKRKMSKAHKGKKLSKEHRQNLRKAWKSRSEKKIKASIGKINIKKYRATSPTGEVYITDKGLSQFCRDHNLQPPNMVKVANGIRPHHKGWICERLEDRK